MIDVDDFLQHYGVRGMKWGVKKATAPAAKAAHKVLSSRNATLKTKRDAKNPAGSAANRAHAKRQLAGRIAAVSIGTAALTTVAISGARHARDGIRTARYNSLFRSIANDLATDRGRRHVSDTLADRIGPSGTGRPSPFMNEN